MTPIQLAKIIYDAESEALGDGTRRSHRLEWNDLPDTVKVWRIRTARIIGQKIKEGSRVQTPLPLPGKKQKY